MCRAGLDDVVALEGRDGDAQDALEREVCGELPVVGFDPLKNRLVVADQIHLVHGQHDLADAEKRDDERMPAGLRQHALAGVDENDGEIGGRGAGRHVAGILLVARRVGDDELALVGGEVAIGDIDGDALLALGRQPVDQQREIEIAALGAELFRIALECRELVVEQQLGFIEQPADQRGLAVVDAAAGDEAQQVLAFLREQIRFDVGRG